MFAISFEGYSIPARFSTLEAAKAAALKALKADRNERQALIFDLGESGRYWFDDPTATDYPLMCAAAIRRPLRGVRVVDYE